MRKSIFMNENYTALYNKVSELAQRSNMRTVLRTHKTNCGDFCIFVYLNGVKRYLVGYDGDWNAAKNDPRHFYNCCESAYKYILRHRVL